MPSLASADEAILVTPEQVPWTDSPVIPNAKGAFLVGDPSKAEVTVLRVKLPPHCKHPPHTHPFSEVATVFSGRLGYGLGDTFDTSKGQMLEAGTFVVVRSGASKGPGGRRDVAQPAPFSWTMPKRDM